MRTWVEVSKNATKKNYAVFRSIIEKKCLLMSVVKSNAYGHNLVDFSKIVSKLGVDWLGVDSIVEAKTLRDNKIKTPILVLGYTLQEKIDEAVLNNISLTVADFHTLKKIRKRKSSKKTLNIHLKIDTGMHRQGFYLEELSRVIKIIEKSPSVCLEGIYTHFSSAKDPCFKKETNAQIEEFKEAINFLNEKGFNDIIKHASATSGCIVYPEAHFDMVRIGIGMYGIWPSQQIKKHFSSNLRLIPSLSWKTYVAQIKKIPKNSGVGYDLTEKVKRETKIAILPIGYWHGFPRNLSSKGFVLINGKKAKVLGRISMDMICIDVTDIKNIKPKTTVIIIGKNKKEEITAEDLANLSQTTSYEIITRINPRTKRITT